MGELTRLLSKRNLPATRGSILELQDAVGKLPVQFDCSSNVTHHFAPMVYGREIHMPKGMVIIGKIHKHAHLNVLLTGRVKVATEFGTEELTAPKVWTSEPGTKRAVYMLEDTRWMTIHPNLDDSQDLEKIEDYVIAPTYEAYDNFLLEERT